MRFWKGRWLGTGESEDRKMEPSWFEMVVVLAAFLCFRCSVLLCTFSSLYLFPSLSIDIQYMKDILQESELFQLYSKWPIFLNSIRKVPFFKTELKKSYSIYQRKQIKSISGAEECHFQLWLKLYYTEMWRSCAPSSINLDHGDLSVGKKL